jgi:NAD(P)-dependent dehydrogenase (short-subunit alcohol dehydrogenase family)
LGNGKAVAVLFAREGAHVVAVDVDREAVEAARAIILGEGGRCEAIVADATSSTDVARAVATASEQCGRIDILHNNVGAPIMGDPVAINEADWQRAIDLNLTTAFLACKHVLPLMLREHAGAIVNVSSLASIQINAYPYFGYLAAKAALNQFTRALAVHYAPYGVRANAVLPGVIDTPLVHRHMADQHTSGEDMLAKRRAASPMGRMGYAWDVAYASLFLASDEAKYITGVCLPVDGGKSCWGR